MEAKRFGCDTTSDVRARGGTNGGPGYGDRTSSEQSEVGILGGPGSGTGGTQTSAGCATNVGHTSTYCGSYGQGGSVSYPYDGGGGGGGLYGGGAAGNYNGGRGGGGGSGYVGGVSNGSMSNGARAGNGYAKITKQ